MLKLTADFVIPRQFARSPLPKTIACHPKPPQATETRVRTMSPPAANLKEKESNTARLLGSGKQLALYTSMRSILTLLKALPVSPS